MEELLLKLVVALVVTELIHNTFEVWGMRQKVQWLKQRMDSKPHGNWPVNIDTDLKAYGLHAAIFVLATTVVFGVLLVIRISNLALLELAVGLSVIAYAFTTVTVHAFHLEIGKLLKRYPHKH